MPYFPEAPPAAPIVPAPDFEAFRRAYCDSLPVLRSHIYLNHASVGPLSDWVVEAVNEYLRMQQMGDTIVHDAWFDGWRLARQRTAELIGATKDEISLFSSTWDALTRVFAALPLQAGDEVLVPVDEFPSLFYALSDLGRLGVTVREVASAAGDGIVRTADLLAAIGPNTKVVATSWVNFFHGYRHDLNALGSACQERGIWFVVDAIQGLGMLALDVKQCGAHFFAGQGAKWMGAPLGSGWLYASSAVDPAIAPSPRGWNAMELNYDRYTERSTAVRSNANRFSGGTYPMPSVYGLRRACEVLLEAGPLRAESRALELADQLDDAATAAGLRVLSDRRDSSGGFHDGRSAIVSIVAPVECRLAELLREAGTAFSVREGAVRLSPHWYTPENHIYKVCDLIAGAAVRDTAGPAPVTG
jgi:cysteine desulfurase/selenocysteine lyase